MAKNCSKQHIDFKILFPSPKYTFQICNNNNIIQNFWWKPLWKYRIYRLLLQEGNLNQKW